MSSWDGSVRGTTAGGERPSSSTPGGGGGFYNLLRLYPERSLGIAIMGNATGYPLARIAEMIARRS
jgi:hypothetical protein